MKKHLLKLAIIKNDFGIWTSLRALIHLELDELDVCYYIAKGLGNDKTNPYCLEFRQKLSLRLHRKQNSALSLLNTKVPIIDYFHWQTLAQGLLIEGKLPWLDEVLNRCSQQFVDSPLQDTFKFFQNLELGHLNDAHVVAKRLQKGFPEHVDYLFLYGYSRLCLKDFRGAVSILKEAYDLPPNDSDVVSLLGYSHLLKADGDIYSSDWERAKECLEEAVNHLKHQALPTDELRLQLIRMDQREQQVRKTLTANPVKSTWIVYLSERRYEELATCSEEDIETLQQNVGLSVLAGDLVFFGCKAKDKQVSLIALYQAVSGSFWHPLDQCHNLLELVQRFEVSIKLTLPVAPHVLSLQELGGSRPQVFALNENISAIQEQLSAHYPHERKIQNLWEKDGQQRAKKNRYA
jgi:tetratricopeptide (TPR) repeat protein